MHRFFVGSGRAPDRDTDIDIDKAVDNSMNANIDVDKLDIKAIVDCTPCKPTVAILAQVMSTEGLTPRSQTRLSIPISAAEAKAVFHWSKSVVMSTSVDETGDATSLNAQLTTLSLQEEIEEAMTDLQLQSEQPTEEEGKEELDSAERPTVATESASVAGQAAESLSQASRSVYRTWAPTKCQKPKPKANTDCDDHEACDDEVMGDRSTPFENKSQHFLCKTIGHHAVNLARGIYDLNKDIIDLSSKIVNDIMGINHDINQDLLKVFLMKEKTAELGQDVIEVVVAAKEELEKASTNKAGLRKLGTERDDIKETSDKTRARCQEAEKAKPKPCKPDDSEVASITAKIGESMRPEPE